VLGCFREKIYKDKDKLEIMNIIDKVNDGLASSNVVLSFKFFLLKILKRKENLHNPIVCLVMYQLELYNSTWESGKFTLAITLNIATRCRIW